MRSAPRLPLDVSKALEVVLERVQLDGREAFGGELAGLFRCNGSGLVGWPAVQ